MSNLTHFSCYLQKVGAKEKVHRHSHSRYSATNPVLRWHPLCDPFDAREQTRMIRPTFKDVIRFQKTK
jgi:hypothetical protein